VTRRHLRRWPPVAERARVAAQLLAEAAAFTDDVGLGSGTLALAAAGGIPKTRVPVPSAPVAASAPPPPAPPPPPPPPAPAPSAEALALAEAGVAFARRGLWAQAVPQFRRAVEMAPAAVAIWCRLGEALNHVDDLEGARQAYEKGLAVDADHPRALYGLGVILDRLRRPDEATAYYRRAREATAR